MTAMTSTGTLARRLGLGDAIAIGLGSMIGAGVFAAFAPAAVALGGGRDHRAGRGDRLSRDPAGSVHAVPVSSTCAAM